MISKQWKRRSKDSKFKLGELNICSNYAGELDKSYMMEKKKVSKL